MNYNRNLSNYCNLSAITIFLLKVHIILCINLKKCLYIVWQPSVVIDWTEIEQLRQNFKQMNFNP